MLFGISIWSLLLLLAILALFVLIPVLTCSPVLKKAGYTRWWSLIMCLPIFNIIAVWVFAFSKWPSENA